MSLVKLTSNQKTQLLTNSFDECMRNHLCGNYMTLPDMTCIEWGIETKNITITYTWVM